MLKIGIIGTGLIAETHATNLLRLDGVSISGAFDTNGDRARDFTASHGGKVFGEIDDMLAESDAVYVCTPPQFHREPVVKAALAGVHVFCEKPLAVTVSDCVAMKDAVERSRILFMIGFNMRFSEAFSAVKPIVGGGELGPILSFWGVRNLWLPHSPPNWRTNRDLICGMTIESLSHDFDILHWVAGDVESVMGRISTSRPDLPGYDNITSVSMVLTSGALANIHSTWASHVDFVSYGIVGEAGSIAFDWNDCRIKLANEQTERRFSFPKIDGGKPSHQLESEHFISCLKTGQMPSIGINDGVATVEISDAVLRSSSSGRAVHLSGYNEN